MKRNKSKHERKRYKEKERKKARHANYKGVDFSFRRMLWHNKMAILTIVFILCIPLIIKQCTPIKKSERIKAVIKQIVDTSRKSFSQQYSGGFVVFALEKQYVHYLNTDDLPVDLSIEWNKARVVKRDSKNIKVYMPMKGSRILKTGQLDLYANMLATPGRAVMVSKYSGVELYAGIIEEKGGIIYCLLGLRN